MRKQNKHKTINIKITKEGKPYKAEEVGKVEATMIIRKHEKELVIFGGLKRGHVATNDIYRFNMKTKEWNIEQPADIEGYESMDVKERTKAREQWPPPLCGHTAAYNEKRDEMIIYGGESVQAEQMMHQFTNLMTYDCNPNIYTYTFATKTWKKLENEGELAPLARHNHAAVYIEAEERYIIHGGQDENYNDLSDLWERQHHRWRRLETTGEAPKKRRLHGMAHLNRQDIDYLYIYGGIPMDQSLYELNMNTMKWRKVIMFTNSIMIMPQPRYAHTLIPVQYRTAQSRSYAMLIFGGQNAHACSQELFEMHTRTLNEYQKMERDMADEEAKIREKTTYQQLNHKELFEEDYEQDQSLIDHFLENHEETKKFHHHVVDDEFEDFSNRLGSMKDYQNTTTDAIDKRSPFLTQQQQQYQQQQQQGMTNSNHRQQQQVTNEEVEKLRKELLKTKQKNELLSDFILSKGYRVPETKEDTTNTEYQHREDRLLRNFLLEQQQIHKNLRTKFEDDEAHYEAHGIQQTSDNILLSMDNKEDFIKLIRTKDVVNSKYLSRIEELMAIIQHLKDQLSDEQLEKKELQKQIDILKQSRADFEAGLRQKFQDDFEKDLLNERQAMAKRERELEHEKKSIKGRYNDALGQILELRDTLANLICPHCKKAIHQ